MGCLPKQMCTWICDLRVFVENPEIGLECVSPREVVVNVSRRFCAEDGAFMISTEAVLLGTVAVLGMIVGLAELRNAVVQELGDFSHAVAWISQDFSYSSVVSTNVPGAIEVAGSSFDDSDDDQSASTAAANGILVSEPAVADDE